MEYLLEPKNYLEFITGGKARFTLKSETSGNHWHYKVKEHKKTKGLFFVEVMTNYNTDSWLYIGYISRGIFSLSKKGNIGLDAPSFKAFDYLFKLAQKHSSHKDLKFFHLGKCARCGKPLTDPLSIELGIGPKCRAN